MGAYIPASGRGINLRDMQKKINIDSRLPYIPADTEKN